VGERVRGAARLRSRRALRTCPIGPNPSCRFVVEELGEALAMLAAIEDARDALIHTGTRAAVAAIEDEIRTPNRRRGFLDPLGGSDG
jgi:hypothetical protein